MIRLIPLLLLPVGALAQVVSQGGGAGRVCPLSDAQTEKSIEAFGKIFPVLTGEPRCVNCHGGVNPFIDGVGDPSDPEASRFEHGGGKMDFEADCAVCHDAMAPKRDGSPSVWSVPDSGLFFIGRDAPTICEQIHADFRDHRDKFVEHLEDDVGRDNFVGTAFMGNRGLSEEQYPEIMPQRPRISLSALINLGKDWLAATGGEFKGDRDCGCKPLHYALRMTTKTEVKMPGVQMSSAMEPVDVPITFEDDGSFAGEAVVTFKGQSTMPGCTGQYSSSLTVRASGKLTGTEDKSVMRFQVENTTSSVDDVTARCPGGGFSRRNVQPAAQPSTVLPFEMTGRPGEWAVYQMPGGGPVSSQLRVEIVELTEPEN